MKKRIIWAVVCIMVAAIASFGLLACDSKSGSDPSPQGGAYLISGTVTFSGAGLQGATMTLSGARAATATTDAGGNYSFTGLANGSYTITPSMPGYAFTPASSAQTINGADSTGVNFIAAAAAYAGQLPLYDDFSSPTIDAAKWFQTASDANGTISIVNGRAQFVSSVTGSITAFTRGKFVSPGGYRAVSADVSVTSFQSTGGNHVARISGAFYNDGTAGSASGSQIGDIHATIAVSDSTIGYRVFRCLSDNCGQPGQSQNLTNMFLANTAVGETHALFLQWDGSVFTFQVDGNPPATYDPKPLAPVALGAPNAPVIWAGTRHNESDGQSGSVTATFDNVRAGAALAITQSAALSWERLTTNTADDGHAKWRRGTDGTKIAFRSDRNGNGDIWVMNSDGTNPQQLTTDTAEDGWPEWSPDGARIAFRSSRSGTSTIWVMNADGSGQTQLTTAATATTNEGHPDWSPDGAKIIFNSNRTGQSQIWVMNADGSSQTQLTLAGAENTHANYSPDGGKIAYQSNADSGNLDIWVMNADGSNPVKLTSGQATEQHLGWSPDGKKIAYDSNSGGNWDIWVMNADGSNKLQLTNASSTERNPDWSADGTAIVFNSDKTGSSELYSMPAP